MKYDQLRKVLEEYSPWLSTQPGYVSAMVGVRMPQQIIIQHTKDMKPSVKKEIASELGDIPLRFEEHVEKMTPH